jgi:hypothetical protein
MAIKSFNVQSYRHLKNYRILSWTFGFIPISEKEKKTRSYVSLNPLIVGLTSENTNQLTNISWETNKNIVNKNINSLVSKY